MSRHWITSDLHLGHANIAGPKISNWKDGYRNFDSVAQMDALIIDNLNKYVAQDDTLWFLGDFCFGGHYRTPDYRRRINCGTIHLFKGNHDTNIDKYRDFFSSMQEAGLRWLTDTKDQKHPFFFSHYAHRVWEGSHKGYFHAYGHSHSSLEHSPYGRSMDFGIDNAYKVLGEYRPFSVDEAVHILQKRKVEIPDHHTPETNVR